MRTRIYALVVLLICGCQTNPTSLPGLPEKATVVILGEAHQLEQDEILHYLEKIRPHSVLLEVPQDLFDFPNTPKQELRTALENQFVGWKYCSAVGAACVGFDMQGNDLFNRETKLPTRQEQFVDAVLKRVKKIDPSLFGELAKTFEAAECGNLRARNSQAIQVGEVHWQRRNQAMASNICHYSQNLVGKTVVVIVGHEHRYVLKRLLAECAVVVKDPFELEP